MLLLEIFDKEVEISPAHNFYGLDRVIGAYQFHMNDALYLCYLDSCAGIGQPNTFGFMKIRDRDNTERNGGSHSLTNDGIPFSVLSAVLKCLFAILKEYKPESVYLKGWDKKQHELYKKMISHLDIPYPYSVSIRNDDAIILNR